MHNGYSHEDRRLLWNRICPLAGSIRVSWGQHKRSNILHGPSISMAPMWIPKVGFFKKQGLDVRVVFIPSGPSGNHCGFAGEADAGVIGDLP